MTATQDLRERFTDALMPNYGTPGVALSHGDGTTVYDVDGNEYLDFIGGIAVSALGHAHPALVTAVSEQVARIAHTSNLFLHEPEVALAEKLLSLVGEPGKVFFSNSGTEANECALKLAIANGKAKGRTYFVASTDGFHGRSMGALALTGKAAIREPFAPFGIDVRFVPYGDAAALNDAVDESCAAVILEPTQGETGVVPPPEGYFAAVRDICDTTGALFIADEIQSGIGRTGTWFAYQQTGIVPDVVTLAKGLGGGLPIGACIGIGAYGDVFAKGDHGSTFGGNPVATAAALAVLDTIESDKLTEAAADKGKRLAEGIRALNHPLVAEVRGKGLWLGVELTAEVAADVDSTLRSSGVLANPVRPNVIRLAPPLVVTDAQIDAFLSVLPRALDAAYPPGGRP
ncbi:acetylornithine transaminase [Stackebrandtia nassauensis]|uniref:Acetylornithine aminotransferase n=1 Tax=Stackebrandtia nassauensis (strain DSM 44728 / CIP 108903 / NRRL B-16338 / NBRC 102104 / LLR-40K-21) TaxID=446470 RepID=D3QAF3_STANL|nr:acetylornithine transaminase [Stackebrandtia nassauensis]ADD42736.1 acetylornithine and succinylornithine aminotransferase [Stackebrandtia nassauensis DSM 44728]